MFGADPDTDLLLQGADDRTSVGPKRLGPFIGRPLPWGALGDSAYAVA
jgi:hypothetical protein